MTDTNPAAHLDDDERLSSGNSDIDETTEGGRAHVERREAIFARSMRRDAEELLAAVRSRIPAVAFEIPASLYTKAVTENDQLTDAERALFRSRGDFVGRVLADPDALTLEEAYRALFWPAPDVVRANVRQATGGRVDSPAELFAEVKAGRILTDAECGLVMGKFCAGERPEWWSELNHQTPGLVEAETLVFARRFYPEGSRALLAPSLVGKDMVALGMAAAQRLGLNLDGLTPQPPPDPTPQPLPEPTPSSAPPRRYHAHLDSPASLQSPTIRRSSPLQRRQGHARPGPFHLASRSLPRRVPRGIRRCRFVRRDHQPLGPAERGAADGIRAACAGD